MELGIPIACSIPLQPCLIDTAAYPHLGFGYCGAGTERAYYALDPLGNIRPCNHSATILGNLLQEPFEDILAPERLKPFVGALPSACAACAEHALCQGGCKAAAQACYGSPGATEPFLRQSAMSISAAGEPLRASTEALHDKRTGPAHAGPVLRVFYRELLGFSSPRGRRKPDGCCCSCRAASPGSWPWPCRLRSALDVAGCRTGTSRRSRTCRAAERPYPCWRSLCW